MVKTQKTQWNPNPWACAAALALVHLILSLIAFNQSPFTGGDEAAYLSLSQSLIQGHGYHNIWDPAVRPQTEYPPVFPLLVAGGLWAGLTLDLGLKLMMIVVSTLAVFATAVWLYRTTTPGIALSAGLFIAISPEIIRLGRAVMSDVPFWLFSIIAVMLWRTADSRARSSANEHDDMPLDAVIAATAATLAAYFTRAAGMPLLAATLAWLAFRRQKRALVVVLAMTAPLIAAWSYRSHAAGDVGYSAPFLMVDPYNASLGTLSVRGMLTRMGDNVHAYSTRHLSWLVFGDPTHRLVFGIPFIAAVAFGWARRLRNASLAEVWLPLYVGMVIVWPTPWSSTRFLLPIVPLLALYAAESAGAIARRTSFATVLGGFVVIVGVGSVWPTLHQQLRYGGICRERFSQGDKFPCVDPAVSDFLVTAERSRGKLPANAVVFTRKPTLFFIHSGYKSRTYPFSTNPDSLFSTAARVGANYVVVDQMTDLATRYLKPILAARHDDFCEIPALSSGKSIFLRMDTGHSQANPTGESDSFRRCDANAGEGAVAAPSPKAQTVAAIAASSSFISARISPNNAVLR